MSSHSSAHDSHGSEGDGKVHSHISSMSFYIGIFATLIFFTLLTVGVSYIHLGQLNLAVAIAIASMKAILVVTFFMHLRYDNKFNAVGFVTGLLFIGVFFAYTLNDTDRRQDELNDVSGNHVYLGEPNDKQAPGGFEPKEAPAEAKEGAEKGAAEEHGAHH